MARWRGVGLESAGPLPVARMAGLDVSVVLIEFYTFQDSSRISTEDQKLLGASRSARVRSKVVFNEWMVASNAPVLLGRQDPSVAFCAASLILMELRATSAVITRVRC